MIERMRNLEGPPGDGIRVLVLDDEAVCRHLMERVLEQRGCQVLSAVSGREGLKLLLEKDVDVLVVDVVMDGMDGPTFLREARKIWPWLGVVVVTGFADDGVVETVRGLGVDWLLPKPLDMDQLYESVLAEAAAKKRRVDRPAGLALDRVRYQLGILRQLSETAIASGSLVEALRGLGRELGRLLPCDVVGLLVRQDEQPALLLMMQRPVSAGFLDAVGAEIRHQHEALTGTPLSPAELRVQIEGEAGGARGAQSVGSTFTVPVMCGGELQGLVILGAASTEAYSTEDIAFLYHAANHLSAVVVALSAVREQAIQDGLTGLYNRRRLEAELDLAWRRGRRSGGLVCLCMIDADDFKSINDGQGHLTGDHVLRELAERIRGAARATDVVGRYGGDEFVVVLPEGGKVAGRAFAERLLRAVRDEPFGRPGRELRLTVSIGVAAATPGDREETVQDVLERADRALFEAKRTGRDRVVVWHGERAETGAATGRPRPASETPAGARILLVDDEPALVCALRKILDRRGFRVDVCGAAPEAVHRLAEAPGRYHVLLTDLQMPGGSGLELLRQLEDADQDLVKIVITGNATVQNAVQSLRHGAYDFIEKPVRPDPLLRIVERAVEYRRLQVENRRYRLYLEDMVQERSAALAQAMDDLRASYNFTLEAMATLLDAREHATAQHTARVRAVAELLARAMGLPEAEVTTIGWGALLHDLGKIAIPDHILLKPAALTPEEQDIMRTHAEVGYRVLQSSRVLEQAAEIVRSHHERFDGRGYPRGLRGDGICLGARLFAVADAYDAMRSDRPYRRAMPAAAAADEIRCGGGTQFDPAVVDLFLARLDDIEAVGGWAAGESSSGG